MIPWVYEYIVYKWFLCFFLSTCNTTFLFWVIEQNSHGALWRVATGVRSITFAFALSSLHTLLCTLHTTLWAYYIICWCSARTRRAIEFSVPSPMLSVSDSTRPFSLHHYHLPLHSLLLTHLGTHTPTNSLKNHLKLNQEGLSGGYVLEDVEGCVEADADVCEWCCIWNGWTFRDNSQQAGQGLWKKQKKMS